jgi:hypothetical protein
LSLCLREACTFGYIYVLILLYSINCAGASGRTAPILIVGPVGIKHIITHTLSHSGGHEAYPLHFLELPNTKLPTKLTETATNVPIENQSGQTTIDPIVETPNTTEAKSPSSNNEVCAEVGHGHSHESVEGLKATDLQEVDVPCHGCTQKSDTVTFKTPDGGYDLGFACFGLHIRAYPLCHRITSYGYIIQELPKLGA